MKTQITEAELESLISDGIVVSSLGVKMKADPAIGREVAQIILTLATPITEPLITDADTKAAAAVHSEIVEMGRQFIAEADSRAEVLRLAASSGKIGAQSVFFHAAFIDPSSGIGHVRPLIVEATEAAQLSVQTLSACDKTMQAAAERAAEQAVQLLRKYRLLASNRSLAVSWLIRDQVQTAQYEGASIGLALGLAIFAAALGHQPPLDVLATGAIDGPNVVGVEGVGRKWAAARRHGFATFLVPGKSVNQLPAEAFGDRELHTKSVDHLEDAVLHLFAGPLGLSAVRLAAASQTPIAEEGIRLELFPTRAESRKPREAMGTTRAINPRIPRSDKDWFLGDEIVFTIRSSHEGYLLLLNFGTSGRIIQLAPSIIARECKVGPGKPLIVPQDQSIRLDPPTGIERMVALLTDKPVDFPDSDFREFDPKNVEREIAALAGTVLARTSAELRVLPPAYAATRSVATPRGAQRNPLIVADF